MTIKKILAFFVVLLLVSPFLVLIWKFSLRTELDFSEFFWAFKNTVNQAFLSAMGSLFLGTWVAWGLIKSPGKLRKPLEMICLVPNFLPSVFVLLMILSFFDPFPVGVIGVAFVHSVINFGLVAVALARIIEQKLGGMAELALIEGSSRWAFFKKAYVPLLKNDYIVLFIFVFSICFSSFSVPLIVGGGKGTTIEVLVYEKIRVSMDWGGAVFLSVFQMFVQTLLVWMLVRKQQNYNLKAKEIRWFGSYSGLAALGVFFLIFIYGYLDGVIGGLINWSQVIELRSLIVAAMMGTFVVSLLTGFFVLAFLMALAFVHDIPKVQFFLKSYLAPSTTLTGFAFLVFGPNEGGMSYFKIALALTILFIGPLYRMNWEYEVRRLGGQIDSAVLMGASSVMIFSKVIWPQVRGKALLLAGLAAAWASGDFALSRILAYKDMTLGLMTETLMSTYRINLASLLSVGLLFCGLVSFFVFWSWGYVYRRKSE